MYVLKIFITWQETSIGLHEECCVFSACSFVEPDSQVISEEAYQPSPVSVLEPPFTEEFSSIDLCSKSTRIMSHKIGPVFLKFKTLMSFFTALC